MFRFWLNLTDTHKWKDWLQKSFLFWIVFFLYIPLIVFVLMSFLDTSKKQNVSLWNGNWNGISNYIKFFSDSSFSGNFHESFINSLVIAFVATPISLVIGILTSVSIWKNYGKGKDYVFLFCNVSISCPDIVQAIAFSVLFTVLIIPLGINLGFLTIILTHVAISIPYVITFIYPRLNKLNKNVLFVSYDLKYTFQESLINVIIPSIFPSILGAALLVFSISFDDFIITNLIRGNVSTVTSEIYQMKTGVKAWSSVFGSLVIVVVFFFILGCNFYSNLRKKND